MAAEKSLALVTKLVDFSETSCVCTLFTRDFGKIAALAKGGRRPKGPFDGALDLLSLCRIVFLRKSPDVLDLLTEARLERRFRSAERDLSRLYAGYYVAELLNEFTDEGDPYPELFDEAERTLRLLDEGRPAAPSVLRLELAALRTLGHMPTLTRCAGCGGPLPEARRLAFGMLAGGALCETCRPGQRQVVSLSRPAVDALIRLAGNGERATRQEAATGEDETTAPAEAAVAGELRGMMNQYLSNLAGRRLRMHKYLRG